MKVVVAVKATATLDDDFELLDDPPAVDPDFLEWGLNEWDSFSLEEGVSLNERDGGETVVVTVAGEEADEVLRECLARGAQRAVRAWDPILEGADPLTIARVLAAVVGAEQPDLVLCGAQSSDAANAVTGTALAAALGLSRVTIVRAVDAAAGQLTVERELDGGAVEVVRLGLPALLTVQTGINHPRYASFRAIKQAADTPVQMRSLHDLGLDPQRLRATAGARLVGLARPQRPEGAELIEGSAGEVAERVAAIIREALAR